MLADLRIDDVKTRKLCSNGYFHLSYFVTEIIIHRHIILLAVMLRWRLSGVLSGSMPDPKGGWSLLVRRMGLRPMAMKALGLRPGIARPPIGEFVSGSRSLLNA